MGLLAPDHGTLAALLGLLGLLIGSFLNVVIHRKPLLLERRWLLDTAQYLQDGAAMPEPVVQAWIRGAACGYAPPAFLSRSGT